MVSSRKYAASPSAPPKPPLRVGTPCCEGLAVRPASDKVTPRSGRLASAPASARDSAVPSRMRIFMARPEPIMPDPAPDQRWLSIVGIGEDGVSGLSAGARDLIANAEIVFGGARHLALAAPLIRGQSKPWPSPFSLAVGEVLGMRGRRVCVLASGDPFFYGVGATLADHIPPEEMHVMPAPSAFSLAAARMGWALPETVPLSVHGRALDRIRPHLHPGARILALTSDEEGPAALARLLTENGFGSSAITVLEALGGSDERLRSARADAFDVTDIAALNTVAIEVAASPDARLIAYTPGLADDLFEHCLLYTSPSPRDRTRSRMPSS